MRSRSLFSLAAIALMLCGGIFLITAEAQTISPRRAAHPGAPNSTAKGGDSAAKKAAMLKLLRLRQSGASGTDGDPCNVATPITIGQMVNGVLTTTDCQLDDGTYIDFYSFNGTSGQPITASMSSGDFDTVLYLLDGDGNIVDFNDDSTGTDSRIPEEEGVIILPFTGEYIIGANSYDPDSTGAYALSVNTDAACSAANINFNQTVNGTLTASDCEVNIGGDFYYTDLYKFNGTAGQQISILQTSAAVNSYLILHTPSGDETLEDDNSGGGNNARIPATGTYTLPETGVYVIEASTFNSFESGAYVLTLTGTNTPGNARKLFDYDGDGKADLSVFRPSNGTWYIQQSTAGFSGVNFGLNGDKIVPADYDGDGKTDIAVYRSGTWYLQRSTAGFLGIGFGQAGDIAVPADYDGDGKAEIAVFRPASGTWYTYNLTTAQMVGVNFGLNGDKPVPADYDGDGKADFAVFRSGTWYLQRSTAGFTGFNFGLASDTAVPADYDGDGKTDVAVFRSGTWYIQGSTAGFSGVNFGLSGDKPVPADYDGDGKSDITVFRGGTWYLNQTTAGFSGVGFGLSSDVPTPNAYVQ